MLAGLQFIRKDCELLIMKKLFLPKLILLFFAVPVFLSGCQPNFDEVAYDEAGYIEIISSESALIIINEHLETLSTGEIFFMLEGRGRVGKTWWRSDDGIFDTLHIYTADPFGHGVRGHWHFWSNIVSGLISAGFDEFALGSNHNTPNDHASRHDIFLPAVIRQDDEAFQVILRFTAHQMFLTTEEMTIRKTAPALYMNLFTYEEYLIIFEPHLEGSDFVYRIIKFNPSDGLEVLLIEKTFSLPANAGEVVSNIFVDDGSIFLYRISFREDGTRHFFIDEYDLFGNRLAAFPLKIEDFLHMPEVDDEDSVLRLYKTGDYFILTTLHNRTAIFRLSGNNLVEVAAPPSFRDFDATMLVRGFCSSDSYVYFWNFAQNTLYILDVPNGRIHSVDVELHLREDHLEIQERRIRLVHRNRQGDLVIEIGIDPEAFARDPEFFMGIPRGSRFTYFISFEYIQQLMYD